MINYGLISCIFQLLGATQWLEVKSKKKKSKNGRKGKKFKVWELNYKFSIVDSNHKMLIEDHKESIGWKMKLKDGNCTREVLERNQGSNYGNQIAHHQMLQVGRVPPITLRAQLPFSKKPKA